MFCSFSYGLSTYNRVFQIAVRGGEIGNFAGGRFFTRGWEPEEEPSVNTEHQLVSKLA